MRTLLSVIAVILLMLMAGWISVNRTGDTTSVTIHREEVKEDTKSAVDQGKELLNKVESEAQDLIPSGEPETTTPPQQEKPPE